MGIIETYRKIGTVLKNVRNNNFFYLLYYRHINVLQNIESSIKYIIGLAKGRREQLTRYREGWGGAKT